MNLDRSMLSVVIPIFNEEESLPEVRRRVAAVAEGLDFDSVEILLVSDGSTDSSEMLICEYVREDPRFRGIFLTRNFGHQAALSIGLAEAKGSVVAVIDGDLQDPPEAVPPLIEALEDGADVAYGIREKRKEGMLKRMAYHIFYRMLKRVSDFDIPLDSGDFCCMRRDVVDAIVRLPERNRFIRGLRAWVGYRQVGVPYEREARFAGAPKYTFRKLVSLAYDGMFSFSQLPARLIQFTGFVMASAVVLVALFFLIWYIVDPQEFPSGFATLVISIWFLAGVQLFSLGIIGEYVTVSSDESRNRPVAIVRQIVSNTNDDRLVSHNRQRDPGE